MKEIILIKTGEIALKGLNKAAFEDLLITNVRKKIKSIGEFTIKKAQSTLIVTPQNDDIDLDLACEAIGKVFGIATFSRALVVNKDIEDIKRDACEYLKDVLPYCKSFKVSAKRADKKFPFTSPQIQQIIGDAIYTSFDSLKVDVHNPEITVTVEIRDFAAYVHAKVYKGAGGMPVGSAGRALLLISGGIDSPVAGYMLAKRGVLLSAVHFITPPYTGERALQKVEDLCEKLCDYCIKIRFYCINFTKISEAIKDNCSEELFTIIMRRQMMKIACLLAEESDLQALITGESLGQVASQTLNAIRATDNVCDVPVFRPCIGMDKNEIIEIARKIDTFDISVLPYEDCCTVFTPKHPRTRPSLEYVIAEENKFDFSSLIDEAIETAVIKMI